MNSGDPVWGRRGAGVPSACPSTKVQLKPAVGVLRDRYVSPSPTSSFQFPQGGWTRQPSLFESPEATGSRPWLVTYHRIQQEPRGLQKGAAAPSGAPWQAQAGGGRLPGLALRGSSPLINCPSSSRKHAAKSAGRKGERSAMGQKAKEQRKEGREGGRSERLVLQMGTKRDSAGQLICPQSFKDPGSSAESLTPSLSQLLSDSACGVRPAPACTPDSPPAHPSPLSPPHTPALPTHPHRCCSGRSQD